MKLNLEMEIDDNMTVKDLRKRVLRFICVMNHEQIIVDHHYIIEKKTKNTFIKSTKKRLYSLFIHLHYYNQAIQIYYRIHSNKYLCHEQISEVR